MKKQSQNTKLDKNCGTCRFFEGRRFETLYCHEKGSCTYAQTMNDRIKELEGLEVKRTVWMVDEFPVLSIFGADCPCWEESCEKS